MIAATAEAILAALEQPTHAAAATLARYAVQPLSGGFNNSVVAFELNGVRLCLKRYRLDDRNRPGREWTALRFLADRGVDFAPQPLWRNHDPQHPAIVMTWLPGQPLRNMPLNDRCLRALADALREMHAITPVVVTYPYDVFGTVASLDHRLIAWFESTAASTDARIVASRALVDVWRNGGDRELLAQAAPQVWDRGDPSLGNCLWDGQQVRFVDFEYAGWTDRAWMLAHLVGGPWAWQAPATIRTALWTPAERDDRATQQRYAAALRFTACFWLYKFAELYAQSGDDQQLAAQIKRARAVL
jgi:aminoglycoside phosphotransferase